jgi:phosphoribosylformylglycinamidine synthase
MAASCIDEALRQIIAVGGSLKEVAVLDNFCWGNPDKPDRLGSLVRASYGCYDAAKEYGVPIISGNDSLNNEISVHGKTTPIPATLLISAIGVMDDVGKAVSMYAKKAGNLIYVVGRTRDELGGSHYYDLYGAIGNCVPKVRYGESKKIFSALSKASQKGLVEAMHDCSDGGLVVALAEMVFSGGLGADIFLSEAPYESDNPRTTALLFSESNSRFVVEVDKKNQKEFEKTLKGVDFGLAGCLCSGNKFKVYGLDGKPCVDTDTNKLKEAWQKPLRW